MAVLGWRLERARAGESPSCIPVVGDLELGRLSLSPGHGHVSRKQAQLHLVGGKLSVCLNWHQPDGREGQGHRCMGLDWSGRVYGPASGR